MNLYATLTDLKTHLGLTATTDDADLMLRLEGASRMVDETCGREFFLQNATRYYDSRCDSIILFPHDILSLSALTTDSEGDNTHDGETWTVGVDYVLYPNNSYPKSGIYVLPTGKYYPIHAPRYFKAVGTFGYCKSANPWATSALTVTFASETATSGTASASGLVAGQTILVGTEQIYLSAVTTTTLTAERGVNGTTAAAHNAAALSIMTYPPTIRQFVTWGAAQSYKARGNEEIYSETIGDYSVTHVSRTIQEAASKDFTARVLGPYVRHC